MSKSRRNRNGFTLTELMVVLGIVGLLIAVATPNYLGMRKRSHTQVMKKNPENAESELAGRLYAFAHRGSDLACVDWNNDGVVDSGGAPASIEELGTQLVALMNSGGKTSPYNGTTDLFTTNPAAPGSGQVHVVCSGVACTMTSYSNNPADPALYTKVLSVE